MFLQLVAVVAGTLSSKGFKTRKNKEVRQAAGRSKAMTRQVTKRNNFRVDLSTASR